MNFFEIYFEFFRIVFLTIGIIFIYLNYFNFLIIINVMFIFKEYSQKFYILRTHIL